MYFLFGKDPFSTRMWEVVLGFFFVSQGSLMICNIISKYGKDSLLFQNRFSSKDSLFILVTKGKKQIRTLDHYSKTPKSRREWGKIREVKKVLKGDETFVEKLKKQPNFYAREGKVGSVFFTNKPMILVVCKE